MAGKDFCDVGATVDALELYPLKGAAAADTLSGPVNALHLQLAAPEYHGIGDRDLVIGVVEDRDAKVARFVSRRGWNAAGLIRYRGDGALAKITPTIHGEGYVSLDLPQDYGSMLIDLNQAAASTADRWNLAIHSGWLSTLDLGDEAAEIVSSFLNDMTPDTPKTPSRELRLFFRDKQVKRFIRSEYQHSGVSREVGGADGTPILLGNVSSLAALDGTATQKDRRRVGANIWLNGLEPFAEDRIRALRFGDDPNATLVVLNACARCVATGVNPDTAERDNGFLRLLGDRNAQSRVTGETGTYFGIGCAPIVANSVPTIRVGDPVKVAWAPESYLEAR